MPSRKGRPNRNKQYLLSRLKDMYGDDFDPIISMAKNCLTLQKIADDHRDGAITMSKGGDVLIDAASSAKMALEAWDKVAQYVEPKLKAIEISANSDDPILPFHTVIQVVHTDQIEDASAV